MQALLLIYDTILRFSFPSTDKKKLAFSSATFQSFSCLFAVTLVRQERVVPLPHFHFSVFQSLFSQLCGRLRGSLQPKAGKPHGHISAPSHAAGGWQWPLHKHNGRSLMQRCTTPQISFNRALVCFYYDPPLRLPKGLLTATYCRSSPARGCFPQWYWFNFCGVW